MTPTTFVRALAVVHLPNVFNPYADTCDVYDQDNAPAVRRRNLRTLLTAAERLGIDTIWMGRDLGYRGGRRTGLALTDERHLPAMSHIYPGTQSSRTTVGPEVAERTAAEIWAVLSLLDKPPLLWNVFPLHPHEAGDPFTNRKFTSKELREVDELNASLIRWLGIRRIVSIGQDAASYAAKFGVEVQSVRHPSYGGVREFREGISRLHGIDVRKRAPSIRQGALF
ncbi:uracil-DNA glycosylase [Diaphorobacter aerolatus]|uniref:Uracil-DNA glycosylase n=2 Tax=Diaphorobacter aerolatus TaxID=1288495 RepID=A0A7H0GNY5_9BURK|nr:uracil-DNA glycosylase [Diaphorobacter aerolatus]